MNLRDIARRAEVLDGQLTLWMMPFLTLKNSNVQTAMEKVVPAEEWGDFHHAFLVVEGSVVDVKAAKDADPEITAFAAYWRGRSPSVGDNYQLFLQLVGTKVYNAIWDAYLQTRDATIEDAEYAARSGDSPEA